MAKEYFKPVLGGNIIDASCGSGVFSRRFAKSGLFSLVVALDYSAAMLRLCLEFVKEDPDFPKEKLTLVRADISRLPFVSGTIDVVQAGAALHCWPSPSSAVAEVSRVLRPGGVFVATTTIADGPFALLPFRNIFREDSSEEDIEGEYWCIVEKPTENIEVLYATGSLGRGSSEPSNTEPGFGSLNRSDAGWNLNCISSLPSSLLLLEKSDLSGSAPKISYGISEDDAHEFEAAARKHTPKSLEKHLKLFHKPGSHLSPGTFESEGIPVYRYIQRPGYFMLFLPRAYHSGFDCGFNCSTSTVFAPLVWLSYGLTSTELYRESKRKTSISYDKLLLRAANEVVKAGWENIVKGKSSIIMTWIQASGKDGVITKALRDANLCQDPYRQDHYSQGREFRHY